MRLLLFLLAAAAFRAAEPHVLFAFDDHALPYKNNLRLAFETPRKHPANPVLARGPDGSVDALRAQFYGSVIRAGGKFRMWYCALATADLNGNRARTARLAYAESDDGIRWAKPALGLAEFAGSRQNNLLALPPSLDLAKVEPLACFVLHEPADPDPARRYKMAVYGRYFPRTPQRFPGVSADNVPSTIYPFFSADGLTWKLAVPEPKAGGAFDEAEAPIRVRNNFEIGGLYRWDGLYHVAGQELSPDIFNADGSPVRRTMVTHWSGDFVTWSQDKSLSFQRYAYRGPRESFQESHEPASVWHRGNVLLATYGLWHGAIINSERRMDLGFLVSNDGIRFREPIPDHKFLRAGADNDWDARGLLNGQGYENVGEQTFIYYGAWDPSGEGFGSSGVGLATLPRDRFASLSTRDVGEGFFTSQPGVLGSARRLALNIGGLGDSALLRVELIARDGTPVAGYSGLTAAVVRTSGLRVPVMWRGGERIAVPDAAVRLRLTFHGPNASAIKFFAAYLE